MDYRLKQAYERVYANEKPLTPRITTLTEAYSRGVLKTDDFLTEALLKNTSKADSLRLYINNLNTLLSGTYPPPLKYETSKFAIVDFIPVPGQQVKINSNDTLEELKAMLKTTTLRGSIGGASADIVVGKLVKTPEIKGRPSNQGDIIEGVLAAAIFAKLTSDKDTIDVSDVKEAINGLKIISTKKESESQTRTEDSVQEAQSKPKRPAQSYSSKARLQMSVRGEGDAVDNFELRVVLKRESMNTLLDFEKVLNVIGSRINSIVAYANEEVSEFAKEFKTNRKIDYIKVIADGVSKNTLTKVDVSMKFVTQDENGNTVDKDVEHFQLSIKTSKAELIGQKSGGGQRGKLTRAQQFEILYSFWEWLLPNPYITDFKNNLIKEHQFNKPEIIENVSVLQMYQTVYKEAFKVLNNLMQKGNKEAVPQETFKTLLENLKTIATAGQKNVKLVQFEEKEYFVLNFELIYDWIKDNRLILTEEIALSERGLPTIKIYGQYSSSNAETTTPTLSNKELLFKVRMFAEKAEQSNDVGYIRNYVEKGPLLVKIVKQQKEEEKKTVASP